MPEGKCAGGTLGVCTPKPEFCTEQYAPVCGCDGSTYGNACFADGAGVSLSYQGECKKPKVTVTTDKKGYLAGSPIKVELANGSSASVFLGGCSAFAWQTQENGKWVDKGPDHICVWEGIAKEVKAGTSHSESLQRDQGTWRVVAGYSVGCAPGKPLSQAGCKASYTAYSAAFKVKSCPMLNMPNPSAFCPDGRMVPNYDADGICITSYSCRPCEVADCGPQLGMPNKLCSDGQTMSGPSGKCIATGWGSCKWEVIECPKCQVTGCSGQICADQEVITTCEYMPWYGCYKQSECGAFGANGGCAWKQTPAFVACMASYGR
jgi:eight-cysteine-cluster-containing protein